MGLSHRTINSSSQRGFQSPSLHLMPFCGSVEYVRYCFRLPRKQQNLPALLCAKKCQAYGYKSGAVDAFKDLKSVGLEKLRQKQTQW